MRLSLSPSRLAASLASLALAACGPDTHAPGWAGDPGYAGPEVSKQGPLVQTGLSTDLAIEGSGFFVLDGRAAGFEGRVYTRAGKFQQDAEGFLATPGGLRVQGVPTEDWGGLGSAAGDLPIGGVLSPPRATWDIAFQMNLDARSPVLEKPWDPLNPSTSSNFSTGTGIYDALGGLHQVSVYFRRLQGGAWEWHALTDGGLSGGTTGEPAEILSGSMRFQTGYVGDQKQSDSAFSPAGSREPQPLRLWFGGGLNGVTSFAEDSAVSSIAQDGCAPGVLSTVSADRSGLLRGAFTNGQTRVLGQVLLAEVPAPSSLLGLCGHLLLETAASGSPSLDAPGASGRGWLAAAALETLPSELARCGQP